MYFFSQRLNQIKYLLHVIPVLICLYTKTSELNYVYTNNFIIQNIVYSSLFPSRKHITLQVCQNVDIENDLLFTLTADEQELATFIILKFSHE